MKDDRAQLVESPSLVIEGGAFVSIAIPGKPTEHLHFNNKAEWELIRDRWLKGVNDPE